MISWSLTLDLWPTDLNPERLVTLSAVVRSTAVDTTKPAETLDRFISQ